MSIATELSNYQTFLANAYNKCANKGATIPQNKNLQNLTTCIDSIPSYTALDYIESTGTQYINPDLRISSGFHLKLNLSFTDFSASQETGAYSYTSGDSFDYRCFLRVPTNKIPVTHYASSSVNNIINSNETLNVNQTYEIEFRLFNGSQYIKIDNVTKGTGTATGLSFNNLPIYLLACCSTGLPQNYMKCRLYNASYYDSSGSLIRDYIPVKDLNGTVCLFDKVENKFYYNQGTGTFLYG